MLRTAAETFRSGSHAGKVVLVTGAGQGIGKAIADAHAQAGSSVAYLDFNLEAADQAAAEARGAGGDALAMGIDVSRFEDVEAGVADLIARFGKVDAVINNAGISPKSGRSGTRAEAAEMDAGEWRRVIDVNLTGSFNCCRAVLHHMYSSGYGRIVNISSVVARTYSPIVGVHYAATKAGLLGLTKHLAGEAGPHGVTVNAVSPGRIATDMVRATARETNEMAVAATPLGRLGLPSEVATTCLFLTSDAAAFVTGQVIDVSGGWLLT